MLSLITNLMKNKNKNLCVFSGNSGESYEGAEVKHEICFERPYI